MKAGKHKEPKQLAHAILVVSITKFMKRIYEFIAKANQILLFLVLLGGAVGISYLIFHESSRHFEPPHVAVAQTPEEMKKTFVKDVRYLGRTSEVYVLGIVKYEIAPSHDADQNQRMELFSSYGKRYEDRGEIVNVVFSRGTQRVRALLERDGMVLSHRLDYSRELDKFSSLLFLCVTEDTDGNHVLDRKDRNDLYIVALDLGKPDFVIKDVSSFDVISPTHLAVKTGEQSEVRFWDVDTENHKKTEIVWK